MEGQREGGTERQRQRGKREGERQRDRKIHIILTIYVHFAA